MLYQCDLQGFLGTLQLQIQAQTHTHTHHTTHTHTHSHTHTHQPHGSAEPCQKMASPLSLHPLYTAGSSLPCNHDLKVTDTLVLTSGPPDANDLDSAPQACNFWSLIRPDGSAPATLASLDARSCGHCILYALTGPRLYTAIPVFASNTGPVTNTFLSFFSGSFQCPVRGVSWNLSLRNLSLRCPHGNAQSKFKVKHGQTWAGGGKHMFGVWIGYGSGMERGMERKALTFPDFQTFCYEYDFQALSFVQAGAASHKNSLNSADNGATCL